MHRTIRAGSVGVLSAACVAGLIAVGGASSPIAPPAETLTVEPTPFVEREQFGTLELITDPDGGLSIHFVDADGTGDPVDLTPRRGDRCEVVTGDASRDTLDQFLDLEVVSVTIGTDGIPDTSSFAEPPALGLVSNGIGSREQNNCNQNNGRIEPGQGIAIALGSDPRFENVVFDYGFLDIEGKFGADIYGETSLAGERVGIPVEDPLGGLNDNSPDSGSSDNFYVPVGTAPGLPGVVGTLGDAGDDFDRLVIMPVLETSETTYTIDKGELALEGGGDFGDGTNRTVFNLVTSQTFEYNVVCVGPTDDPFGINTDGTVKGIVETSEEIDWFPVGSDAEPTKARVFRYFGYEHTNGVYEDTLGDGYPDPKAICDPIGANLSADGPGVLLEPSDESAFFRVELTWIVPAADVNDASDPAFDRTIDVDGEGDGLPKPARYCEGFGPSSGTINPASTFEPTDPGVADHVLIGPNGPEFVPWCVLSDVRELKVIDNVDVIVQTMVWDGIGDPYFG